MTKIHRRCKCGCGSITNYGRAYINHHHLFGNTHTPGQKHSEETILKISLAGIGRILSKETKKRMSLAKQNISKETRRKMSLVAKGKKKSEKHKKNISSARKGVKFSEEHKRNISLANKGREVSKTTRLKISLANLKHNPNYEYCDIWKDKEYKDDIRKDYCEDVNCKGKSKRFHNHHIYLDKKRCTPNDIMTLCTSCHSILHRLLENISKKSKRLYHNK